MEWVNGTLPSDVVLSGADNVRTNYFFLGGALPPLKFGIAKNVLNRADLGQLSNFSANISGTDGGIDKR